MKFYHKNASNDGQSISFVLYHFFSLPLLKKKLQIFFNKHLDIPSDNEITDQSGREKWIEIDKRNYDYFTITFAKHS